MSIDIEDETIDSLESWLDKRARARASGRLTVEDALDAYIESTGNAATHEEMLGELSSRYEARVCEYSGDLLFFAVIYI